MSDSASHALLKGAPLEIGAGLTGLAIETISTFLAVAAVIYKLGRAVEKFEAVGKQQAQEIGDLKGEVKIIADVITKLALTNQRQEMLEARQERLEVQIDDLRRGEGFIMPFNSPRSP